MDTDDARAVFGADLELPRGERRERVRIASRDYDLRGSEVQILATAGAFRVVDVEDFGARGTASERLRHDIEHLKADGLIDTFRSVAGGERTTLVTLTEEGRDLLEASRRQPRHNGSEQAFHAGVSNRRELAHDTRVYRAYLRAADRAREGGGRVRRIVLENDLKREYQSFLQERNTGRPDSSGRPDRDAVEIARWASDHQLPLTDDGHVQFPDVRVEVEERDGTLSVRDLEVVTPHYRGAHAAAKARSGFARYRATGSRIGGGSRVGIGGRHASGRGGGPRESRLAEEMLE